MTFHGETTFSEVVTENAIASLSDVKIATRIETSDEDAFIIMCMTQAKTFLESLLDRKLDDSIYECTYRFKIGKRPRENEKLWLPVAPISNVKLDGIVLQSYVTPNGWDKYLRYDLDWPSDEMVLEIETEWGDWLDKVIKVPFITVAATFYRYREFSLASAPAVNNVVYAALKPYMRQV